jgi:hypothetical protein
MPDFLSTYCHLGVLYVLGLSLDTLLLAPRNGVTGCTPINSHRPLHRFRYDTQTLFAFSLHPEQDTIPTLNTARLQFRRLNFCAYLPHCLSFLPSGNSRSTMLSKHLKRSEKSTRFMLNSQFPSKCNCTNTFSFRLSFHSSSFSVCRGL